MKINNNQSGSLFFLLSVLLFSVMELLVKLLSNEYPTGEIVFARGLFGLIPILIIIPKTNFYENFKTKKLKLHIIRTATGCFALVSIFIGIKYLPLADAISITFAAPIFATFLSIFILNEVVGKKRWFAVVIGFIGILIILKPGTSLFSIYTIFPIFFCIGFAASATAIKILSETEENYLIAFYYTLGLTFVSLFLNPFDWRIPSKEDFIIFFLIGITGSVGNILITEAYRKAEVSLITPIKYLNLIFAIVFGYFLFNEVPSIFTIFGSIFIILSTIIIFTREKKLKKKSIISKEL
tara:strand:- start:55 stop:942 length:888 start_codon:yes stop_codon:yes gene_type:complete